VIENPPVFNPISITARYRRLWSTVPSSTPLDAILAHLRILRRLADSARSEATRARVAVAANEAAAFAGRLAFDLGNYEASQHYYRLATSYAKRAGDDTLAAYTLGSMSLQSVIRGDGEQALTMVEQAKGLLPIHAPPVVQSRLAVYEASAYSAVGDAGSMQAAVTRAEKAISKDQEPWVWTVPLDARRLTRYLGFCATNAKLPAVSVPALHQGLAELGPVPSRWRALCLSNLARSYILTGEIEEACSVTEKAFDVGIQLKSDRVLKRVAEVRRQLGPWKDTQAVKELEERMVTELL
jgi:tetratricopeptide (TPR) repeat protein